MQTGIHVKHDRTMLVSQNQLYSIKKGRPYRQYIVKELMTSYEYRKRLESKGIKIDKRMEKKLKDKDYISEIIMKTFDEVDIVKYFAGILRGDRGG